MRQLMIPVRKRSQAIHTPTRRRRSYQPICMPLENRRLLSVSLTLTGPTVPLVGSPATWIATASGEGSSPVFRFSVAPPGGAYQVVQDFSPSDYFTWNPLEQGSYDIRVIVKRSYSVSLGEAATTSYTALSRVVGTSAVISATTNPLVALYSAPPSPGSSMYVQFSPLGPNPSWQDTTPLPIVPGESTNFLVAGLLPNTRYIMRDVLDDGTTSAPLAFASGSLPTNLTFPTFTDPLPPTPSSDLSQNMVFHMGIGAPPGGINTLATDLAGNIVWYFDEVANNFTNYSVSLVPGGTVLMLGGNQTNGLGGWDTLREIDLAGDTVRETNIYAVSAELAKLGYPSIYDFSHDAKRLPNGDTAVIAGTTKVVDVNGTPTTYNGDMVVVLNKNFRVVWVWNAFDWLDTSRLPPLGEGPGDWTHANSISYSPEDGDLLVSLRAQDWVLKIDYANGTGDGHIVWRLGAGGDFAVVAPPSVVSPWFSHQHDAVYVNDNTIVLFDDGNGRAAVDPNADSRGQEWILNEQTMTATLVVNADLGNYSPALGSAQMLPNGNLAFTSGIIVPNYVGQTIEVLPDGTQTFVQQLNGLEYRSYLMSNFYGSPANILNPGFEYPIIGTGSTAWMYDPSGSSWSFSGRAGISGNDSALTSANPNAPQGSQVAFLQNTGTISQVVNFALAGAYQISFSAAERANSLLSDVTVEVQVDGTLVGTFTPRTTRYASYTTSAFNATAGAHTIAFVGVDPIRDNHTDFVDAVSVNNVAPTGFSDSGFESPSLGSGTRAWAYRPADSSWTFSGTAGESGNDSAITSGNPNALEGSQVAFLQRTGAVHQLVNFAAAGSYVISFSAAQRGNHGTSNEMVEVLVDGAVVGTFIPASTSYANYTTASFNLSAGSHTVTFAGLDPTRADYTAFLDQVSVTDAPPAAFADAGFESPSVGTGQTAYVYRPTGSPWTFAGTAGISGNDSAFTSGNPNAPEGGQVGFLQGSGAVQQAVNFAAAGSYVISASAAQRGNNGTSNETVEVLVDGTVVGTFTPTSTAYASYATDSFNVTAGSHILTFAGFDPTGSDYTAFLDQVSITSASPTGFSDPSFENPSVGTGQTAYVYGPSGSAWSFSGSAGLSGNGSAFTSGNPNAPQGSQVAFVQATGTVSQVVNTAAPGSYMISFSAAQRGNYIPSYESVEVEVDGAAVGIFTPTSTIYATYMTASFKLTSGTHTIAFVGIDPTGTDYTVFLDQADLIQVG
jgi:hypothetical protein